MGRLQAEKSWSMATPNNGYFTYKKAAEAYVVQSKDKRTLTFYYDKKKDRREGKTWGINETYYMYGSNYPAWTHVSLDHDVREAVFDTSFKDFHPTSTAMWFYNFVYLGTIENMEYLNTKEVTTMRWMFGRCASLKELNLTSFKTSSKLKNTENMFYGCSTLLHIYCNDAWTSETSKNMFHDCQNLQGAVKYDPAKTDIKMANPTTGYFTRKGSTGINRPTTVDEPTVKAIYGTDGRRRSRMEPGINILKMSDGTTRKVVK